jgi:hypothetical protein
MKRLLAAMCAADELAIASAQMHSGSDDGWSASGGDDGEEAGSGELDAAAAGSGERTAGS